MLVLLVLFAVEAIASRHHILILHNNDMHARFEETSPNGGTCKKGCVGGFARTAHEIRRFRSMESEDQPVLYLNGGDTYVGTAWFAAHKWRICAEFMNALKPDAMSLGNHEFDFRVANLAPFVEAAQFPLIAANLDFSKEPSLNKAKKSVILEKGGLKIGVIGHLTPDTQIMSSPEGVIFNDVVESVKKEAEELDKQGVKILIALGHSGFETDKQIAKEVPLIDVVVGGHTNTFLWNGPQPDTEKPEGKYPEVVVQKNGRKVPVVQAYAYTKYLGVLNVTFDDEGNLVEFRGQPEFLNGLIPQDKDFLDLLEKYRPGVEALDKEVVGKTSVLLDATMNKCRHVECNFANLITDAFVYYMAGQYSSPGWTDTPIGLINGGSIRTTIDPTIRGGNITRGDLMGTLPFENQVVTLTLNGSQLLETLEIGARSNGETSKGEFLQASGLQVVYDMSKPSYSRVVSVKARCGSCKLPIYEKVQPNLLYRIVTVGFLTGGGDSHHILRDAMNKRVQDLGDVDTLIWYLGKMSPVYPEENGRVGFVEGKDGRGSAGRGLPFGGVVMMMVGIVLRYLCT